MELINYLDQWVPAKLLLYFAVLLNPFSQVILLWEPIKNLSTREFSGVYFRATLISFGVYLFFAFLGEWVLTHLFQVRLSSLKIFGGLIILTVSFRYLLEGAGSNILFKVKKEELPSYIALPYIIGPATLWVCILIGRSSHPIPGMSGIGFLLILNWLTVVLLGEIIHRLGKRKETLFAKYLGILMRTNSLFIGAIGVEMIVGGILEVVGQGF